MYVVAQPLSNLHVLLYHGSGLSHYARLFCKIFVKGGLFSKIFLGYSNHLTLLYTSTRNTISFEIKALF